jgi:hypothetical protein
MFKRLSAGSPPPPTFDIAKVKVIDAFWFPDGEEGRMAEGQCVTWVDYCSVLQIIREQDEFIDSVVSIMDREIMKDWKKEESNV